MTSFTKNGLRSMFPYSARAAR